MTTHKTPTDTADTFMWEVADILADRNLTHRSDFQEFCANMFGMATASEAAESWGRR